MKVKSYFAAFMAAVFMFAAAPAFATAWEEMEANFEGFEYEGATGAWAKLREVSNDVLVAAAADSEIAPFFVGWEDTSSENFKNLSMCLTNQLAFVVGSPDHTYPLTLENGHACQEMIPAHIGIGEKELEIGQSDFRKFISIAANTARGLGLNLSVLAVIGDFLYGLEGEIVRHVAD